MNEKDIVRHQLVTRIVEAYARQEKDKAAAHKKQHKKHQETDEEPIFRPMNGLGDN